MSRALPLQEQSASLLLSWVRPCRSVPRALGAPTAVFPTPVLVTTYSPQSTTTLAYNYNLTLERQIGEYVVRLRMSARARECISHVDNLNPSVYVPGRINLHHGCETHVPAIRRHQSDGH